MTQDVLDRLADICDRAVTSAPIDPTSPTLYCLAIQRGCPSPVSQTRRGRVLLVGALGDGSPVPRPRESGGGERALVPLSITP
jgi:hypothetical protein